MKKGEKKISKKEYMEKLKVFDGLFGLYGDFFFSKFNTFDADEKEEAIKAFSNAIIQIWDSKKKKRKKKSARKAIIQ